MTAGPATTDSLGELRAWFDERTTSGAFSGRAVIWRDGGPIFSFAGGLAHRGHGVPVNERTRFSVASITKMTTAIAALQLVEQGRIALDTPLPEILPPGQRPASVTREHTLHHLLSHTSGLASYLDDDDPNLTAFKANWNRIPTYNIRRPGDLLPLFVDLPAVASPGSVVVYNDAGFVLVGLVVEAVTGRAWGDVVTEAVFEPAGMIDTGLDGLDDDPARLAVAYMEDDGPPDRWRSNVFSVPASPMPDGGMITTPDDLCRLIDTLNAGRLLGSDLLAAMTRPQGPPSDEVEQWGYGCRLTMRGAEVVGWGHGGGDPGVSALLTHYPVAATTVAVTCNFDRGSLAATHRIAAALGIDDPSAPA